MAEAQIVIECGFCLRKNKELPSAKTLPCTHVHCLQCLTGYYTEHHMLMCPTQGCGKMVERSPDALPSYDLGEQDNKWCDVCMDKRIDKFEAAIFCTVCSNKLCGKHLDSHDELLSKHKKRPIEEYRAHAAKMQKRTCTKHEGQPYSLGCRLCMAIGCVKCFTSLDNCNEDKSHDLMSLEDLVAALMKDDISAKAVAKEEQYEKLCKETSKVKADYDTKTTEFIQLIHQIRDAQLDALKYQKMEDELVEKRQKSRMELAEFMEEVVLKKWTQLVNCRKMVESRMKLSHQVDVMKGFKEWMKLVEDELPKLQITNELQLKKLDVNGAVELEVVSSCDIVIDCEQGVKTLQPPPTAMELLKSVKLPANPLSACHHNGIAYVGLENKTVATIDNNYQLEDCFICTTCTVESIAVYKDRFYILVAGNPRVVRVYDMSGEHITGWTHPDHGDYSNMLTVVADQVLLADPAMERITVYSLTGEFLRHIPCPLLSPTFTTLCAVDNTSIVISSWGTSKVFRVNIDTAEVMWTLSDVDSPQGLACYGGYIILAAYNNQTIYVLDTTTGNIVSEIEDSAIADTYVFGLGVDGTTLVVPKYDGAQALFYQLKQN